MKSKRNFERFDALVLSSGKPVTEESVPTFKLLFGARAVVKALDEIQDVRESREQVEGLILALDVLLSLAVERSNLACDVEDAASDALAADHAADLAADAKTIALRAGCVSAAAKGN